MEINSREHKELEKLKRKSEYTKLSQAEARRLQKLEGMLANKREDTSKQKWVEDRKSRKFNIIPKSEAQRQSLNSFELNKVTVCSGSVATGKTAVATWWAGNQIVDGKFKKILISRPNTPLGDRQNGFRAGDLIMEKLYGFHLPMIEYLSDIFGRKAVDMQLSNPEGFIQIVDFEALRGQTFGRNKDESCIVLFDESQLLTSSEMDCVLTRMGEHAKIILTGDPSVHQRENTHDSGLVYLEKLVEQFKIPDIGFVKYKVRDICRSDFVYDYVVAMQQYRKFDVE